MLRFVRWAFEIVLLAYVLGVVGLAIAAFAAPLTGHGLYAVRSPSMAPTLQIGDLVVVEHVIPDAVREGDIVAIALASGVTLTHRVEHVQPTDDGPVLTTRGDANDAADPVATRPEQLRGRVALSMALLGFLLAMLAMPTGVAALFSIGAALLTAVWMLDDVEAGEAEDALETELDLLRRRLDADAAGVA